MNESKKIKKLEKVNKSTTARFKKENSRPSRARTETLCRPPRAFDESEVYLIECVNFLFQLSFLFSFILSFLSNQISDLIRINFLELKTETSSLICPCSTFSNILPALRSERTLLKRLSLYYSNLNSITQSLLGKLLRFRDIYLYQ